MTNELEKIRTWNGSEDEAFEELCCQLAEYEQVPSGSTFIRKAPPDAGVECFWQLPNGDEYGWQAKYFLHPPDNGQWKEIDESVKTVLEKHSRIISYIICLPIDRPDARVDNKASFLDKWTDHTLKWKEWAKGKNLSVDFTYWGSHEIWDRLSREEHKGRSLFWLHSEFFSQQWFQDRLAEAIANAGARYTPELNVELPIARLFEGLGRTSSFLIRVKTLYGQIKRAYSNVLSNEATEIAKDEFDHLQTAMQPLQTLLQDIRELDVNKVDWDSIHSLASEAITFARVCIQKLDEVKTTTGSDKNYSVNPFDTARHYLHTLVGYLSELDEIADSKEACLSNVPALLLVGDAGTGKTHLFCDVAKQRINANLPTVLLLGTQFRNDEPWSQIIRQLGLSCSREEFLGALDATAKARKSRALIMIDGLNEGDGKNLWSTFFAGMLTTLTKYPWIGNAVSARTSYEKIVIPDGLVPKRLVRDIHYGFSEHEYDATKTFFSHFGIVQPSVPLLVPEFQNPLFLKLFCQGLKNRGYTQCPPGMQGITSVFSFFIDSVNEKLSKPQLLDFDPKTKIVQRAVEILAELMANTSEPWLPREIAQTAVDAVLPRSGYEKSLFGNMISEGILAEDRFRIEDGKWQEGIHFTYERFTDHLIANYLFNNNLDPKDPLASFAVDKPLGNYVKDERSCLINRGIMEAFSIQLPERIKQELFDVAPYCAGFQSVQDSFVDSLVWRNPAFIMEPTKNCINKYVITNREVFNRFLNALLTVACNPDHPYNADFLHHQLVKYTVAERDVWWSTFLHYQYGKHGAVDRIVDWAWSSSNKNIDDKSIRLCGVALAWMLTTSNRFLRDRATKALVAVTEGRLPVLREVIHQFVDVNDPYVLERLFGVAYGCAMRSTNFEAVGELAKDVYTLIFEKGEPPPDILLRDYARGIVEVAIHNKPELKIDLTKIRPPYKSAWPSFEIPSAEELKKYGAWEKGMPDVEWARVHLYESIMGFEDFARYIIGAENGSGIFEWSSRRLGAAITPTRQELYEDFERSLTAKQKKAWDAWALAKNGLESYKLVHDFEEHMKEPSFKELMKGESVGSTFTEEELKELITVSEKDFRKTLDSNKIRTLDEIVIPYLNDPNKDEYKFDLSLVQRWILQKVFNLGWTKERFGEFDRNRDYNTMRSAHKAERIGKKYQWIAYHEILARISDNFEYRGRWSRKPGNYEGPWQFHVRDIDPSSLLKKTQSEAWQPNTAKWWVPSEYTSWTVKADDVEWLKNTKDLLPIEPLIQVTNPTDGSKWLVLEGIYKWEQPTPPEEDQFGIPRRDLSYVLQSFVLKTSDLEKFFEWAKKNNFFVARMPESRTFHNTFLGEFFVSPAYECQSTPDVGYEEWSHGDNSFLPTVVLVPVEGYSWESGSYDCSIDESIFIRTPAKWLTNFLKLHWKGIEGEYYDSKEKLLAFDPSVRTSGPSVLLLNEEALTILRQKGYDIVWMLKGEKMILGNTMDPEQWKGRLQISGLFRKNGEAIEGFMKNKFESNSHRKGTT
jgi:hypothetical protein